VRPKLNREYTFETFIVGSSNRVAHAAALAVSESPGKAYNPLSLYGSSGVGKTHLLHAICHRIVTTTRLRVSCATAESVFEDVSASIDGSSVFPENSRLLDFDVIAIDDLEFTTSRERVQQAFFRFLELAVEKRIQLIVSSPVHPRSVQGLLPRFSLRFGWGLALELETPGLEGRVAILVRKAHQRQHDLPVEVAESLAARVTGSIRELEGTLLRLLSYASFTGAPLSLDTARLALRELFDEPQAAPGVTMGRILSTVQEHYRIKPRDLLARSKARGVVLPRQVAMYLARQHTHLSLEEIGLHFGGRDHTTVLYAEERMTKLLRDDPEIRATLQVIESRLFVRHRYGS
jgi:chromosomal replication initiator protein